jgi:hypothetical protein
LSKFVVDRSRNENRISPKQASRISPRKSPRSPQTSPPKSNSQKEYLDLLDEYNFYPSEQSNRKSPERAPSSYRQKEYEELNHDHDQDHDHDHDQDQDQDLYESAQLEKSYTSPRSKIEQNWQDEEDQGHAALENMMFEVCPQI